MTSKKTELDELVENDNKIFRAIRDDLYEMETALGFADQDGICDNARRGILMNVRSKVGSALSKLDGLTL